MWQSLIGGIFIFVLFYILPFLLVVVLPAWSIPLIVKYIFHKKRDTFPSFKPFVLSLIFLAFLANLFWEFALFNKVYYEWDRVFLPYTFFWHESPLLDGSSSWIAAGWKPWHLHAIWLVLTIGIYSISAFFAYCRNLHSAHKKEYRKILFISLIALTTITLLPQILLKKIPTLWGPPANLAYQEVNIPCTQSSSSESKILYSGDQAEWISDISGRNLHQAFKKNLQLRGSKGAISPNGTMVVSLVGQDVWIHCVNSDGAFRIPLPKFYKEVGYYEPRSFPSWSPDSKYMIMNNNGDLLLIDLIKKSTRILKSKVALKDNKIDITSKDRDTTIPPFEIGFAYWSSDDLIYYTSFIDNGVLLHKLNLQSSHDEVVRQSNNALGIDSGDPSGKWLLISEYAMVTKKNKDNSFNKRYFLNTQTYQIVELKQQDVDSVVWSPSGKLIAQSTGAWQTSPTLHELPATILNIDTQQSVNITDKIRTLLQGKNIQINKHAVVIEIKDFVDESKLLVTITLVASDNSIPRRINGIFDMDNNALSVLQDYHEESFETHKGERLEPLQIIR